MFKDVDNIDVYGVWERARCLLLSSIGSHWGEAQRELEMNTHKTFPRKDHRDAMRTTRNHESLVEGPQRSWRQHRSQALIGLQVLEDWEELSWKLTAPKLLLLADQRPHPPADSSRAV